MKLRLLALLFASTVFMTCKPQETKIEQPSLVGGIIGSVIGVGIGFCMATLVRSINEGKISLCTPKNMNEEETLSIMLHAITVGMLGGAAKEINKVAK